MKRIYFLLFNLFLLIPSASFSQDFPTKGEIYDYEVGDVFHRVSIHRYGEYNQWYYTDSTIKIIEVINKTFSANNDTVTFYYFVRKLEIFGSYPQISYDEYMTSASITGLDQIMTGDTVVENENLYNGRITVITEDTYIEGPEETYYEKNWVVGCGLAYDNYYYFSWVTISQENSNQSLVYYKKGDEEWGEEQTIVGLYELTKKNELHIFPNPTHDFINFQSKENSKIHIYNSTGQLLFNQFANSLTSQIDVSMFPTGIYFVNLIDEDGLLIGKAKFLKL